jgi:signal peptidase II
MHRQHVQQFGWHLGAALLIALADIWLKTEVMSFLFSRETSFYTLFNGFNLHIVWNTGVSFGLFRVAPPAVLLTITGGVVVGLVVWLYRTDKGCERWALSLIIGGALGNIRDRVLYGAVFDFLDFYVGSYHWPAFNLADSCIVVGVLLLLYTQLVPKKRV